MIFRKEEVIKQIKDCGQELIDNAENIANNFKYSTDLTITCYISWHNDGDSPRISVDAEFIPSGFIERLIEEDKNDKN